MRLGLVEVLVKNYVRVEPDRPPKIAADTQRMLDKSKSYEPFSKLDLSKCVEHTGKIGDFFVFRDLTKMLQAKGNRVDDKTASSALFKIDKFVRNNRFRLLGRDGQWALYDGLVLKEWLGPHMPDFAPELHYGHYFNTQPAKKPRIDSNETEVVTEIIDEQSDDWRRLLLYPLHNDRSDDCNRARM